MFAHFNHSSGFFLSQQFQFFVVAVLSIFICVEAFLSGSPSNLFLFQYYCENQQHCHVDISEMGKKYVRMRTQESITIATSFLISRDVDTHYRVNDTAHFQFELDDFYIGKSRLTFLVLFEGQRVSGGRGTENVNALAIFHGTVPKYFVQHHRMDVTCMLVQNAH